MRNLLKTLCIVFACTLEIYDAAAATSAQDVYASASPSVVVVVNMDENGRPVGTGSGVVIQKNHVVTNWHVVDGGASYIVRRNGTNFHAQLVRDRRDRDLALLNVEALSAPPIKFGSAKGLKVGQQVFAIGAPSGLELTLTNGLVSALRDVEDGKVVQTSAPISPGSSGGGLFDEDGKLVGITTLKMAGKAQEGLGFAVPVEWVGELSSPSQSVVGSPSSGSIWFYLLLAVALLAVMPMLVRRLSNRLVNTDFSVHSNSADNLDGSTEEANVKINTGAAVKSPSSKYESFAKRELKGGKVDEALMKKARSLADGDEEKLQAIYVSLRSDQISERYDAEKEAETDDRRNVALIKNSIMLKKYSFIAIFVAALGVGTYWATQNSPAKGSPGYATQFILLKIKESAYSNESLYSAAEKYHREKNFDRAFLILKYLEKENMHQAEYLLGVMYRNGEGVEKNVDISTGFLERSAKKHNADANLKLGDIYRAGDGTKADLSKSINYYQEAAQLGSPKAYGNLSDYYGRGLGTKQDWAEAYKWAEKGAAQGDALAQSNLGILLYYGYGTPINKQAGISWMEKAAQQNFPDSLLILAGIYFKDDQHKDLTKAKQYLERAASTDDSDALYRMGEAYGSGELVQKDITKAMEFFIKACKLNNPDACWRMGSAYLDGVGMAKDQAEGIRWIKQAAQNGSVKAMFDLGYIFLTGYSGVAIDERESFNWFLQAAMGGARDAYIYLANAYFRGKGVAQDYAEATKWYEYAAKQNSSVAQAMLAEIYWGGLGTQPDYQKAKMYAENAAAGGASRGNYILGLIYLNGNGVPQNDEKALNLLSAAFYAGQTAVASTLSDHYTRKAGPYQTLNTLDPTMAWAWSYVTSILLGQNMSSRLDVLEKVHLKSRDIQKAKSIADNIINSYRQKNPPKNQ